MTERVMPAAGGPRARAGRTTRLAIRVEAVLLVPPPAAGPVADLPLVAVSATEVDPPDEDEPLHWRVLTTARPADGEAPVVWAATVGDWYRQRWVIETGFRTLKTGTRLRRRRLDPADDRRQCLAFDAITASRVADLTVLAREPPDLPATAVFDPEQIDLRHPLLRAQGHTTVPTPSDPIPTPAADVPAPTDASAPSGRNPPAPTDRSVPPLRSGVIDLGRGVGLHPSKSPPLPGAKKVRQGLERLNWAVLVRDALGERKRE